jgi:hypothetical protein
MSLDLDRLLLAYRIWSDQCDIDHFDHILRKQGGWLKHRAGGCYDVYIPYRYHAWYLIAYPDLYRKKSLDLVV